MNEYLMDEDFLNDAHFEMPPSLANTNSSSTAGSDFQWNQKSLVHQETILGLTSCNAIADRHCEKIDLNKFDPTILNGNRAPTSTIMGGGEWISLWIGASKRLASALVIIASYWHY